MVSRNFTFWDETILWFGAASLPAAWYYGALMAGFAGLPGAFLLIFVFSTIIFIPWALLGYIASKTGASSMALVRPTFGIKGSKLPSVFYLIFGFGWGAVNVFLAAIAMSFIFSIWLGWPAFLQQGYQQYMVVSILVICFLQGAFAVAGHKIIKWMEWVAVISLIALGAYQTYLVLSNWGFLSLLDWTPPAEGLKAVFGSGIFSITYTITFALLIDLLIAYNWTWQFIGDFSRFAKSPRAGSLGPFIGANLAQYWWFFVGALGVVFLTVSAGAYNPAASDPSSTTTKLGFGWIAYIVILAATIATNAGNIYASALGMSNINPRHRMKIRKLLLISAFVIVPVALVPLLSPNFVGFYIFFLDFLGAIVVPLWTLTLVDYFFVKKRQYSDDIFKEKGGAYWYKNGWNAPAVATLILGTVIYWIIAFGLPRLREKYTAAIPTIIVISIVYYFWAGKRDKL
ncbi:cytosine permease [Candidatus Woesearchaeota archaeon]|nr:cytosine permease [Candidatus Woesearchaeota archaeon]